MKKAISFMMLIMLTVSMILPLSADAATALDEIQNYDMTVNMRSDGSMDIAYHIDWKVLNDTSEGPLEWVKIGIPNSHVDSIQAKTANIRKIGYLSDDGNYVRVDFDRKYYANEIVSFDFSVHQSYMYTLNYDSNLCEYQFTPGWFDDIQIKAITIAWEKEKVLSSDAAGGNDGYLLWASSLSAGEKYTVSVTYNIGAFSTSDDQQYTEEDSDNDAAALLIPLVIVGLIILFVWVFKRYNGNGGNGSGLGRNGYFGGFGTRTFIGHGGYNRGCACASSCACACACACAGGGRAGCSAKNFYGAVVQMKQLQQALQRNNGGEGVDKDPGKCD